MYLPLPARESVSPDFGVHSFTVQVGVLQDWPPPSSLDQHASVSSQPLKSGPLRSFLDVIIEGGIWEK